MDALQRPQAAEHQACADEQNDGQRHLHDDQRVAEALARAAAGGALAAVLQGVGRDPSPKRPQRRRKAEEDASSRARMAAVKTSDTARRRVTPATRGMLAGFHHASSRTPAPAEREADDRAQRREQQTLGEQLARPRDGRRRRARRARRSRAAAPRRAPAAGSPRSRRRSAAGTRPRRTAARSRAGRRRRLRRCSDSTTVSNCIAAGRAPRASSPARCRAVPRRPARPSRRASAARRRRARGCRDPCSRDRAAAASTELGRLRILEVGRQHEVRRHHADDLVQAAVDLDGPSDDRRIGAVAAAPQRRSRARRRSARSATSSCGGEHPSA